MRVAPSRLAFHALCVLEEEARRATRVGKIAPKASVRLALGYLYAVSRDGPNNNCAAACRIYWKYLTQESETDTRTAAGFGRWQMLNSCLNSISEAAGIQRDYRFEAARQRNPEADAGD